MSNEYRADHLAADERWHAGRARRELPAELAGQKRCMVRGARMGLAQPHGEARVGLGCGQAFRELGAVREPRDRLESVVAVVAVQDENVAAVERALEVPLEKTVGLALVCGDLHDLGELALCLVVRALGGGPLASSAARGQLVLFESPTRAAVAAAAPRTSKASAAAAMPRWSPA